MKNVITNKNNFVQIKEWSEVKNTVENYLAPDYYNSIIKDYIFNNLTDLELFREFLKKREFGNVLELGSGSGRCTEVFLEDSKFENLHLVDLSDDMINFVGKKFNQFKKIKYDKSDHIDFLSKNKNNYDLVFSLWSFSHSINAHINRLGIKKGGEKIGKIIKKFVKNNINLNGEFYIIHFDSMSEEQSILMKQWERIFPVLKNLKGQSPSKILLDKIFQDLDSSRTITLSSEHMIGEKIVYKDAEEFLEVFMNFHLETFFNKDKDFVKVKNNILKLGERYKNSKGEYIIKPGCFIYKLKRM